jgi:regulatory protein
VPAEIMPPENVREEQLALDQAVRALARRDHSAASLRAKLERAGVSESAQAAAIRTLEGAGYLDDARYARERAALLASRGYGDARIRAELRAQEVDGDSAEAAVAALEPEAERARCEAAKMGGGGVRALRTLARRGFSAEALEKVAGGVVADDLPEGVGYESSI